MSQGTTRLTAKITIFRQKTGGYPGCPKMCQICARILQKSGYTDDDHHVFPPIYAVLNSALFWPFLGVFDPPSPGRVTVGSPPRFCVTPGAGPFCDTPPDPACTAYTPRCAQPRMRHNLQKRALLFCPPNSKALYAYLFLLNGILPSELR